MASRSSLLPSLRALSLHSPSPSASTRASTRAFSSTSADQASTVQQRKRHRDPYALAQARARKAANISRQEVLKKERAAALGDPVRGVTTPFVQSFDTALPPAPSSSRSRDVHTADRTEASSPQRTPDGPDAQTEDHQNFFLTKQEIRQSLDRSELLSAPAAKSEYGARSEEYTTLQTEQEIQAQRIERHGTATEALRRIASLSNGSSKDRLRVNIQRCISTFGRHNTDSVLPPKAAAAASVAAPAVAKSPRVGPDTGSSEVQVAILTAKIRTLADYLETRGRTDKVNKRNLRVLVHKRQKLLNYLRRKERGGSRWTSLIETLGLTEGTWKGEISL